MSDTISGRKRAGRKGITRLAYSQLLNRVSILESKVEAMNPTMGSPAESIDLDKTKPEIMEALTTAGIDFNPRDKKDVLAALLEG